MMDNKEDAERTRELELLLEAAADDLPGAVEGFFKALLESKVYVPTQMAGDSPKAPQGIHIIGESSPVEHNFVSVIYDGKECLPIFTQEEHVYAWAGAEVPVVEKDFKALLWIIGEETWLYLNSNQEVGKEFSPWEISLLRKGEDAIEELVNAQSEDPFTDIEIRSSSELYPELKRALLPVLQIYPELEEAFVVAVKEGGNEEEKPLVGIRYGKIAEGKKAYLRSELEYMLGQAENNPSGNFLLMDDLGDANSPNHELFAEATPFYIGTIRSEKKGKVFHEAADKLLSIFTKRTTKPSKGEGPSGGEGDGE